MMGFKRSGTGHAVYYGDVYWADSARGGRIGWLGANLRDLTKEEADALGWEEPRGAKVVKPIRAVRPKRQGCCRTILWYRSTARRSQTSKISSKLWRRRRRPRRSSCWFAAPAAKSASPSPLAPGRRNLSPPNGPRLGRSSYWTQAGIWRSLRLSLSRRTATRLGGHADRPKLGRAAAGGSHVAAAQQAGNERTFPDRISSDRAR